MARGAAISVQNQFTKGLITEQSIINFPENAVTDTSNCVFSELGPVTRRLGMDYENNHVITPFSTMTSGSTSTAAYVEFKWFFSTTTGTINFVVQQVGREINFFQVQADTGLSAGRKSFTVDLNTYKVPSAATTDVHENPCSFSAGKGYLFVVHPFVEPLAIQYSDTTDTITVTEVEIQIRDFEGVEDSLDIDERPSSLSNLHEYNLWNQGWLGPNGDGTALTSTKPSDAGGDIRNLITFFSTSGGKYPSNADIWWTFKDAYGNVLNNNFNRVYLGNTPAPKGHYIYNAFNMDRVTESGLTGLNTTTSNGARPSCTAFYAGRSFYSGISANGYSDKVYFTQIIESDKQFGRCYQINDPTSEKSFDLLDSDGGEILLPQVDRIVAMYVLGDALIVLGTNSIFSISGNDNGPFRATNYTVSLISTTGVLSAHSLVNADGTLLWINSDALYALSRDKTGLSFGVQNISKETIQSLINDIPSGNRSTVKGVYNHYLGIVQWLYSDSDSLTGYRYNSILEFNTISQAFYPYHLGSSTPVIVGAISVYGQGASSIDDPVTMNDGSAVTTDSGDPIVISLVSYIAGTETFKYATAGTISGGSEGFTYSTISDPTFVDWKSYDSTGIAYDSYFVIGYRIRGDILRPTQCSPIEIVLKEFTDAEIKVTGIWDYGFRTTTPQYLYGVQRVTDSSHNWTRGSYRLRRCRFRGKGRSFQLRFDSDGQSPFEVFGWSSLDTGGQQP